MERRLRPGSAGDPESPRRRMTVRRRRHDNGGAAAACCEGWEGNGSAFEEGRHFPSWRRRARGKDVGSISCSSSSRGGGRGPAMVLLAQAVLSFVGMVLLPTRLAYDVLIQPSRASVAGGGSPVALKLQQLETASAAAGASGGRAPAGRQLSSSGAIEASDGGGVASELKGRRRSLQEATAEGESFTYSTRTQFHLCAAMAGSQLTEAALRAAIVDVFGIDETQIEGSTGTVERTAATELCDARTSEEWAVAIGNEATGTQSAAAISAEQMELVRAPGFTTTLADSLNGNAALPTSVDPAGLTYNSLGYVVLYDPDQAAATTTAQDLGTDFVSFSGPDQWWPWWAWLLFGLALLLCICPLGFCIYYFRPGYTGPPSPTGGGPNSFGRVGGGSKKSVVGGSGEDPDWDLKAVEKGAVAGGGYDKDDVAFNDAATGVSSYSPLPIPGDYVNAGTATAVPADTTGVAGEGGLSSGEWPEALMESGVGVTGVDYTSQGGSSTKRSHQGGEESLFSEADRAAGEDPGGPDEQDGSGARSMNPLVTSASFRPAASRPSVADSDLQDSTSSLGGGSGSAAAWAEGAAAPAASGRSVGSFVSGGASGRSLGDAAAALGEEEGDEAGGGGDGASSNFGRAQSHRSNRTDEESIGKQSTMTSTLAALEAKAEADEAELAASPAAVDVGTGSIGGPSVAAAEAAAATAAGLPPSGRPSLSNSARSSFDPAESSGSKYSARGSRAASTGSAAEEFRQLTDDERQQIVEESDAARAASYLRGTAYKVPLQPDLERAITEESQERRRQALQVVDAGRGSSAPPADAMAIAPDATESRDVGAAGEVGVDARSPAGIGPPPTSSSLMGRMVSGLGIDRFFSASTKTMAPAAVGEAAESKDMEEFKAAPAEEPNISSGEAVPGAAAAVGAPGAAEEAAGVAGTGAEYVPVTGEGAPVDAESVGPASVPPLVEAEGAAPADSAPAASPGGSTAAEIAAATAAAGAAAAVNKAGPPSQEESRAAPPPATGATASERLLREGSLSPDEVTAYSAKVDRALEELPAAEGHDALPMSELLARAEMEATLEAVDQPVPPSSVHAASAASAAAASAAATVAADNPGTVATSSLDVGRPPVGPSAPTAGSRAPALDVDRLYSSGEQHDSMVLDEVDSMASPVIATPPALLRPNVGAAGRAGAAAGRRIMQRNSASGSYRSSRSNSVTESNNNFTEDDNDNEMSSDAHTTDGSRTSSYLATGSSFEESLAQSQAASGRFLGSAAAAAAAGAAVGTGVTGAGARANPPPPGDSSLSSLAERLASVEERVDRDYGKGLLYVKGPEGVAAAVAGEELPPPPVAAGAPRTSMGGSYEPSASKEERVESLADILARADGGPGNLKETFRMLDVQEAKRLEDLNAAASAAGADDETKARWRGSLAELMLKADRAGNVREFLDHQSEVSGSGSVSEGNYGGVSESDSASASGSSGQRGQGAAAGGPRPQPE